MGFRYVLILFAITIGLFTCEDTTGGETASLTSVWEKAKEIEANIAVPTFPDRTFNVLDFGAVVEEGVSNTEAFKKAIVACHDAGGGKVVVPEGVFESGPLHLLDNVNLHLEKGAELRFSTNPKDFLPLVHTSFEGTE